MATQRDSARGRAGHRAVLPLLKDSSAAPIGIFMPSASGDARSRERAGEHVYELRDVYEDVVEVRFADGEWLLCDFDEVRPQTA